MASPVVETNNPTVFVNGSIAASNLFSASDPDDQIVSYTFSDFRDGANTGFFRLNGIPLANGASFTIDAVDLPNLTYVGGSRIGYEGFRLVARDQVGNFSVPAIGRVYSVRSNTTRPHVRQPNLSVLANEVIPATEFVRGFDPDGYPLTRFEFSDLNKMSMLFSVNGKIWGGSYQHRFETGDIVTITGADQSRFNISAPIEVTNDHVFRINMPGFAPGTATGDLRVFHEDFGYFELDGTPIAQGTTFEVEADQLENLVYRSTGPNSLENIYLRGFDGVNWSTQKQGIAETRVNANRPSVQFSRSVTPSEQMHDFTDFLNIIDPDNNSYKRYLFYNTSPHLQNGDLVFQGNNVPRKTWVQVEASELDQIKFYTPKQGFEQLIRVMAYDGKHWSNVGTHTIESTPPIIRPEVEPTTDVIVSEQLETLPVGAFFAKTDRGESHTRIQVYEGSTLPESGNLQFNGVPLESATVHEFSTAAVPSLTFRTGDFLTRQEDMVYSRFYNGNDWSKWNKLEIRTEPEIDDVLTSGADWNGLMPINQNGKMQISFSFMQEFPDYETGEAQDNDPPENFEIFTDAQRDNTRLAFRHLEEFLNIQFVEVSDSSTNVFGGKGGIMRFGEYGIPFPESTASAFAFLPGFGDPQGDVWINRLNFFPGPSLDFEVDTWGYKVMLHEIGHAMGLKHPFSGQPVLPPSVDVNDFTVMSYGQAANGEPATYQLYDVRELQSLYGANTEYKLGDDTYSIGATFNRTAFVETIWDAGGNDTLSGAGAPSAVTVDIREGSRSSIGAFPNNVTIAYDVKIENAVGSDFNDTLIGNPMDNHLHGGLGDDYLISHGGNDIMTGAEGDDVFEWGPGDGDDIIDEMGLGGRDTVRISNLLGADNITEDLKFTLAGRDLQIDLSIDGGSSEGVLTVHDHLFNGFRVESLEIGSQRIDLANLTSQIAPGVDTFVVTGDSSTFGLLVVPA